MENESFSALLLVSRHVPSEQSSSRSHHTAGQIRGSFCREFMFVMPVMQSQ